MKPTITTNMDKKWERNYLNQLKRCDINHLILWRRSYIKTLALIQQAIDEEIQK